MSGAVILAKLASESSAVCELVEPSNIVAEGIKINSALPSVSFLVISDNDRNLMSPRAVGRRFERVQATVVGANISSVRAITKVLRKALGGRFGDLAGSLAVDIQTAGGGPESEAANPAVWMKTQDFRVSYNEPI
jgi:hypothetical protein